MINERQYIEEAIYDWVAAVVAETGRTDPVIWNHGDGPRPVPPFISLEFTGTSTPGTPNYSMVDPDAGGDGERTISRFVRRALTMYAFGEGALDLLETVKDSIDKIQYMEMLELKGLVIPQALEVTEHPANRSGISTEYSALFEFYVTYTRVTTDSPGWIETAEITPHGLPMELITNKTADQEVANG